MKIILVGYMGSGKTAVGKSLSEILGFNFHDLDHIIEKEMGMEISQIFSKKGEIHFRKNENEILKIILETDSNLVLATGGGTPCYGDSMDTILTAKDVQVFYLKANLETLTHRLFPEKEQRPLISHLNSKDELQDFISKHLFERSHYYSQAHKVIVVDGFSVTEITQKIVASLF